MRPPALLHPRPRRHGGLYDYFICGGRTARICNQPHHRVEAVEAAVERHYATIQLTDEQRERIRTAVRTHLDELAKIADKETGRARAEVIRLDNEERKLLSAHYADTISDHIFAEEQNRIRRERVAADQLLRRYEIKYDTILDTLDLALELTDNIQAAYLQADPTERRLLNQAFFERIEIDSEEINDHTLAEPFRQDRHPRPALGSRDSRHSPAANRPRKGRTPATPQKDGGSYLLRSGGACRDRTGDLRLAKPALSQLS